MEISSLAYNRREIRDKRPLGRGPDRSWCHLHTIKLSWSLPVVSWTSATAYECAAARSMDPLAATKKALHQCGGNTSSCPGPYATAACAEFHVGCRLDREIFTLPLYGLRPRKLYHSVAVTPAPVRVPTQRSLVPCFMAVVG